MRALVKSRSVVLWLESFFDMLQMEIWRIKNRMRIGLPTENKETNNGK